MIFIDTGQRDERSLDSRLIFAGQMRRLGLAAALDEDTLPPALHRNQKFEAEALITSRRSATIDAIMLIGAEKVADATLSSLRGYRLPPSIPVVAVGRFSSVQERIGASSRIAFSTGIEPVMIDLAMIQPSALLGQSMLPLFAATDAAPVTAAPSKARRPLFVLVPDALAASQPVLDSLAGLAANPGLDVGIITSAKCKPQLVRLHPRMVRVMSYAELSPMVLAERADMAIVLGDGVPGERMGAFLIELLGRGGVVIDATQEATLAATGAPVVRGPKEPAALPAFVEHGVMPQFAAISAEVRDSDWLRRSRIDVLVSAFPASLAAISREGRPSGHAPRQPSKTVFMPTNGIGLGHAQRCSQIARAMATDENIAFAAFPSCVELIARNGYSTMPLVQKSSEHSEPFANDLLNYRRLKRLLAPGDRFVFDGVHVFDSVYRTILEGELDAVWIRRGLWRGQQVNETSLSREHCFNRVVVPEEAFPELNQHYSFGAHIHHVGPVLQQDRRSAADRRTIRETLAQRVERPFDKLVVSMLGGGVASDRGPQLQMLSVLAEERKDMLHLVVVWPNATIAPGLSSWNNTRIVRTFAALGLCQAADLVISAVGYNSFHELLYHHVPTIFLPQIAPYMDDQERRARAAVERGLADIVMPEELLILDRKFRALLDQGGAEKLRERLCATALPAPGNLAAALAITGAHTHETRRLA